MRIVAIAAAVLLSACTSSEVLSTDTAVSAYAPPAGRHVSPNFGDSDPYDIKGRKPQTYAVHGVDVSKYNPKIDWTTAKRAGVEFAFIKATEGKDNRDPLFKKHWAGAAKAGIPRSAYHFYYFCASAKAQAKNYIRRVPKSANSLPPVLDVEWNPKSPTCRKRPSRRKVVAELGRFLKIVERHYGQKPIIYTTVDFHRDNLSRGELPGYQYWLRSVTAQPKYKYPGRDWVFWQYSGTGRASGFRGDVDLNVFHGDRAKWKRWVASNTR